MLLSAEFSDASATRAAIRSLRAGGVSAADCEVFSAEPVDLEGALPRPSRMSLAAVTGAVTIGSLATAFVYYTQHAYPLPTGGMPLFSFWATGVVSYELTLLGAIAATFLTFLWESGLLRRRRSPPPALASGRIGLRVACPADQVTAAAERLYQAGALQVSKEDAP